MFLNLLSFTYVIILPGMVFPNGFSHSQKDWWKENIDQYLARAMASIRLDFAIRRRSDGRILRSLHGASESKTSNTCEEHTENSAVGLEDWSVRGFQLSKDLTVADCQVHKTVFKRRHQPTKATRTTSIMEPSLIEPTNVTNCPKQVPQSHQNPGRLDQINHGKVIDNIIGRDIPKVCGPIRVPRLAVATSVQERCPMS